MHSEPYETRIGHKITEAVSMIEEIFRENATDDVISQTDDVNLSRARHHLSLALTELNAIYRRRGRREALADIDDEREAGRLSDEEYEAQRKEILDGSI